MAEVQFTLTATISATVSLPDRRLKAFLSGDIDISDYFDVKDLDLAREYKGFTIEDCSIEVDDLDTSDIESIEKSNGDSYEWDGEKLKKL
jgi:hypothetical protein